MKKNVLLLIAFLLGFTISGFAQQRPSSARATQASANQSTAPRLDIVPITDQTYTGAAIMPEPVIKLGTQTLVKDTDYRLTYANNTNVGTATITITGIGNFNGVTTLNFNIIPMSFGSSTAPAAAPASGSRATTVRR